MAVICAHNDAESLSDDTTKPLDRSMLYSPARTPRAVGLSAAEVLILMVLLLVP